MSRIIEVSRLIIIFIIKIVLHFFWLFPVKKNRILFSCYEGNQFSCNPKYIFLALRKEFGNKYEYIWILNNEIKDPALDQIKKAKFLTVKYFYYICTSAVYINNVFFEPFVPKRKSQLFINTWHGGGAYKGNSDERQNSVVMKIKDKMRDSITDYYISSCEAFSKSWSHEFNIRYNKFLPIGLPRNDILITDTDNVEKIKKIKTKLGIENKNKIVLYAPTWRFSTRSTAKVFNLDLDISALLECLKNKYSDDFVFLFRGHHCMHDISFNSDDKYNFLDVTYYPDMQEVLLITDVFINDYSSSMWDFALTKRPGYLYTPDLKEYESEQHFLTPIDNWPYQYAETFVNLLEIISKSNKQSQKEKIEKHIRDLGTYEKGNASMRVCSLIEKFCNEK